jgi:hypothetical protein
MKAMAADRERKHYEGILVSNAEAFSSPLDIGGILVLGNDYHGAGPAATLLLG